LGHDAERLNHPFLMDEPSQRIAQAQAEFELALEETRAQHKIDALSEALSIVHGVLEAPDVDDASRVAARALRREGLRALVEELLYLPDETASERAGYLRFLLTDNRALVGEVLIADEGLRNTFAHHIERRREQFRKILGSEFAAPGGR
jgi:hypothetical protein